LNVLLLRYQGELPKSHEIATLLGRVAAVDRRLADSMRDADALTPFGVDVRYPGEAPELLPDAEREALDIFRRMRNAVMTSLQTHLKG
jgi:HEPN domain-containing protein